MANNVRKIIILLLLSLNRIISRALNLTQQQIALHDMRKTEPIL